MPWDQDHTIVDYVKDKVAGAFGTAEDTSESAAAQAAAAKEAVHKCGCKSECCLRCFTVHCARRLPKLSRACTVVRGEPAGCWVTECCCILGWCCILVECSGRWPCRYGGKASSQYKDAKAQAQDPANWEAAKAQAADAADATRQHGQGLLNKVTHSVAWFWNQVFIHCRRLLLACRYFACCTLGSLLPVRPVN